MYGELFDFLKMNDVKYKENLSLGSISPIKIGGIATVVAYPDTHEKLIRLLHFLEKRKIKYKILGRMSNVLPPDNKYDGVIIRTDLMSRLSVDGLTVEAEAGVALPYLAKFTADIELGGLAELSGIPASIGGAIRQNAGAFGKEISSLVDSVRVYDIISDSVVDMSVEDIGFSYRSSGLMNDPMVVLSAKISLIQSDKALESARIEKYKNIRRSIQPVGSPSLGSVFKRPGKDLYAARMIDDCGLKGKRIGGAEISGKHAGFIINKGGATAADYISLADFAAECVFSKFGVRLEREIEII